MSARIRVLALVSVAAAVAAAVVVGATLLQSEEVAAPAPAAAPEGSPPLVLDLGFRRDAEARELRRAEQLYDQGRSEEAARVFVRYGSLDARIGLALAHWPRGTLTRLSQLAAEHPRSGLVRLNLGFALFWSGRRQAAVAAWREARRVDPDSLAAVRAADVLYPNFAHGLPVFVASPRSSPRLLEGIRLQRLGKQLSARRTFDAAVEADPDDPEALVAAAVARFDKADPSKAFARLGPLARRFPGQPTVRFHLGLLLLWMGQVDAAKEQLAKARAADPDAPLAREANRFLRRLEDIGTS